MLAHHLIFYAYGGWLSNDLRGSGSTETRNPALDSLGPVHVGRKRDEELPSPEELRAFYAAAEPLLQHRVLWFDERLREGIADAFAAVIRARGYTCWACAVLQNHAHLLIRVHRDGGREIWDHLATESRLRIRAAIGDADHPVWAERPYSVFKHTPRAIEACIPYIEGNPRKHRLGAQRYPFVIAYDGWPFHR